MVTSVLALGGRCERPRASALRTWDLLYRPRPLRSLRHRSARFFRFTLPLFQTRFGIAFLNALLLSLRHPLPFVSIVRRLSRGVRPAVRGPPRLSRKPCRNSCRSRVGRTITPIWVSFACRPRCGARIVFLFLWHLRVLPPNKRILSGRGTARTTPLAGPSPLASPPVGPYPPIPRGKRSSRQDMASS